MIPAGLEAIAAWVWDASWHAAIVVLVVLSARQLAGRRLPPGWRCGLWLLVAARLLVPAPQGAWSLFGLLEQWKPPEFALRSTPATPSPPAQTSAPRITITYGPVPSTIDAAPLPPAPPPAIPDASPFKHWLIVIWIAGTMGLLIRSAIARRRLPRGPLIVDPRLLPLLDRCRLEMKVRRPVVLVSTAAVSGPALTGIHRPRILLPPELCDRLAPEQLRYIFLHELAHVRRHDILMEWAITFLSALHWFNPAVWLAAHLYRADRELARDAMVLRAIGPQQRQSYGHTLLGLLETLAPARGPGPSVAMLGGKHRLKERISMIAQLRPTPARITVVALLLAFALMAWVVLTNPKKLASTAPTTPPATHPSPDALINQAVQAKLDRRLPEINLNGQGLADVIDYLRDVSEADIFVNWRALEAAGISKDAPVTARMRDVKFSKALTTILADAAGGNVKLAYAVDQGVITISTADDFPKNLVTSVYDIRDLAVSIPSFDSEKDYPSSGRKATTVPAAAPAETMASRAAAIMELIRATIDPQSWRSPGGYGSIRELNGQLIVTQTQENHGQLLQLLDQLRQVHAIQIAIEARFIAVDKTTIAGLPPELRDRLNQSIIKADGKRPTAAASLNDKQVGELLAALQSIKTTSVLSSPRLTTFNGQRAYVAITNQRPYVADLKVVRQDGKVSFEPIIQTVDEGLIFDVQGTVSADRSFVTLTLRPRQMILQRIDSVPFDKLPDDQKDVEPKPKVQRPVVQVREIKTTLSVSDGGTLVLAIGALSDETGKERKVPVLSDVPLMKDIFTIPADASDTQPALLILVKPKMILQRQAELKP